MAERGNIFKEAPILAPQRSWFDMSYENTFSMNFGDCVPCAFYECLPGDHIKARSGSLTRFAPMLAPVMGSVNQFTYHFFVRLRDIWTNFDKFITNNDQKKTWQQNITGFVPPTMPYFKPKSLLYGKLGNSVGAISQMTHTGSQFHVTYDYGDLAGYRLYVGLRSSTGSSATTDVPYVAIAFVDKDSAISQGPSRTVDLDDRYGWYVLHFKPNNSEFDFNYAQAANGLIINRHMLNPFGNGQLCDYLGIDLSGIFNSQGSYYQNAIGINNFFQSSVVSGGRRMTFQRFDDLVKQRLIVVDNQVDPLMALDTDLFTIDFSNFGDFFRQHCVTEVDIISPQMAQAPSMISSVTTGGKVSLSNSTPATSFTWTDITPYYDETTEDPLSALPIRAYRFIYDEFFRDENYIPVNSITDFSRDGDEFANVTDRNLLVDYLTLFRKAWEHDPYTTALPSPQRGNAVHFLPSVARITTNGSKVTAAAGSAVRDVQIFTGNAGMTDPYTSLATAQDYIPIGADLSAATIENFRWANAMQKYLEKKSRTGGRYFEYLLGIWNKSVDDAKLNRPIYLDGERIPIQVSEVLQTGATDSKTMQPLGDMAGRATAVGKDTYLEYECPDYGFFIEVTCVIPRVVYQQGVAPHFTRENYLDYPLPDFAMLGEEYVKRRELYYTADSSQDNMAFGYQSRYYQWKYKRSEAHGDFKDSMNYWTFARIFDSSPVAGRKFLECNPDYRQFAIVTSGYSHVYCQMWHDTQINRALPEFGVPVL